VHDPCDFLGDRKGIGNSKKDMRLLLTMDVNIQEHGGKCLVFVIDRGLGIGENVCENKLQGSFEV
jgi:hypothetical protein